MCVAVTPGLSTSTPPAVSRLAPSPTGALHLGNARTFLANWAMARRGGWKLWLRIEDLDTPRIKPGVTAELIDTLTWLGIDWDRWPALPADRDHLVQSDDLEPYRAAMRELALRGLAYPCQLTRTQIEQAVSAPQEGAHDTPYPASLRPCEAGEAFDFDALDTTADPESRPNWRLTVPVWAIEVADQFAGRKSFDVSTIVGDYVLWTRRGQPSYQLAVVIDDHRQGVNQVVRGDDLLDSAARQLLLYRLLGRQPEPAYTHLPLVLGPDGRRLAKRHGDTRIQHYRDRGVPADAIRGLILHWCDPRGMPAPCPVSREQFLDRFSSTTIPAQPITFTAENDSWLLSQASRGRSR